MQSNPTLLQEATIDDRFNAAMKKSKMVLTSYRILLRNLALAILVPSKAS